MNEQSCGNCRFFKVGKDTSDGECRRHAPGPAMKVGKEGEFLHWPIVDPPLDWCGEWQSLPVQQGNYDSEIAALKSRLEVAETHRDWLRKHLGELIERTQSLLPVHELIDPVKAFQETEPK